MSAVRERAARAARDTLCDHRIVTLKLPFGTEWYRCEADGCEYDTDDYTAWEEYHAPLVVDAVLAEVADVGEIAKVLRSVPIVHGAARPYPLAFAEADALAQALVAHILDQS